MFQRPYVFDVDPQFVISVSIHSSRSAEIDIPHGPPLKEWTTRPRREFKSVGQSSQVPLLASLVCSPFVVSGASIARRVVES